MLKDRKRDKKGNRQVGLNCIGGLQFHTTPDNMRVVAISTTQSGRIEREDLPKGTLKMIEKWEETKRNLCRHAKTLPNRFWRKGGKNER